VAVSIGKCLNLPEQQIAKDIEQTRQKIERRVKRLRHGMAWHRWMSASTP
jgi:3-phenylpropionate/cinnamic acid dioxygenase small subunit